MQNSRSFSSQILKIFLPVSLVILLLCITVSLYYFFRIRGLVFDGTEKIIRRTGESMNIRLQRQEKQAAELLVQERARNISAELNVLADNLVEMETMIRWAASGPAMIAPAQIPLPNEIPASARGAKIHMTTPNGSRSVFQGKTIPDWRFLEPLFSAYRKLHPETLTIYFTLTDGYTIEYDDHWRHKRAAFDGRNRSWYKDAVRDSGISISAPYEDIDHRGMVVTASLACRRNKELIGVVGIDGSVENIYRQIRKAGIDEQHLYLLLDRHGKIIPGLDAGSEKEKLAVLPDDVRARILRWENGKTNVESQTNGAYHVFWSTVQPSGWKLLLVLSETEINESSEQIMAHLRQSGRRNSTTTDDNIREVIVCMAVMSIGALVLLVVVSFRLATHLARPISDLNEALKEMRRSGKFEPDLQRQDELGALSRTLSDLFSDWEEKLENAAKDQKK